MKTQPTVEGSSFLRVSATVGSGITVEHAVRELFLTETLPNRANYMVELLSHARSTHSIDVAGRRPIVKCGIEPTIVAHSTSGQVRICTINPYLEYTVYFIKIFEL